MNGAPVRIIQPRMVLHGSGVAVVSALDGQINAEDEYGFFAGDTRVLSTYKYQVNGSAWTLLAIAHTGHGSAQWYFQNPPVRDELGELEAGSLAFVLKRRVDGALHDDLEITSYGLRPACVRLTLQIDADFADLFQVKSHTMPARLQMLRQQDGNALDLLYERAGFRRGLQIRLESSQGSASISGSRMTFQLMLNHGDCWKCCLEASPKIDDRIIRLVHDPHRPEPDPVAEAHRGLVIDTDPLLAEPFSCARNDLHALAMCQQDAPPFVAAGVPWFLALFGRDSLFPALLGGLDGSWSAEGALHALAMYQADRRDDFRDAEPGKLPHELRQDELTFLGELPYSPYYGAHGLPSLYCLTLWHVWQWTGKRELLDRHMATALRCLQWCDQCGDRDGDGLQEYGTRSRKGYRNQAWKDAGDAIVDRHGRQPDVPLATVEMQGYLYAAREAMALLLEERGEPEKARELRNKARDLRARVEQRYWMEDEAFYALALDAKKRQVDAIASNAGHLLWTGLASPQRAAAVARRLLSPDMFSGWGLRTLSASNPAYNPLSYQRGSVWPFDSMLAAAGLWRYGHTKEAFTLMKAILDAAGCFEYARLPELFAGLDREHYGAPAPYQEANVPQAWSSAVPIMAAQLILGLVPDAPRQRCFISPRLPDWLTRLSLNGIRIGDGTLDIALRRLDNGETAIEHLHAEKLEVLRSLPNLPLWGRPLAP